MCILVGVIKIVGTAFLLRTAKIFIGETYCLLRWEPEKDLQIEELQEKLKNLRRSGKAFVKIYQLAQNVAG